MTPGRLLTAACLVLLYAAFGRHAAAIPVAGGMFLTWAAWVGHRAPGR